MLLFERKSQRVTEPCVVSRSFDLEITAEAQNSFRNCVSSFRRRTVTRTEASQSDSARRVSALLRCSQARRQHAAAYARALAQNITKSSLRSWKALLSSNRSPDFRRTSASGFRRDALNLFEAGPFCLKSAAERVIAAPGYRVERRTADKTDRKECPAAMPGRRTTEISRGLSVRVPSGAAMRQTIKFFQRQFTFVRAEAASDFGSWQRCSGRS